MAVAGLAALLTLGGCTGSPDPSPAPTSAAPSATSSAEPTGAPSEAPVPPEKPAAMANDDEAGARAAADYFLALYGYTLQSGDFTLLDAFCNDESTFCAAVSPELAKQADADEKIAGGDVRWASEPQVERQPETSAYALTGTVLQDASELVAADGSVVGAFEAEEVERTVYVYWESGEWHGFDIAAAIR